MKKKIPILHYNYRTDNEEGFYYLVRCGHYIHPDYTTTDVEKVTCKKCLLTYHRIESLKGVIIL